jgi:hypothetical protein
MPLAVAVFLVAGGLLFGYLSLPQNGVAKGRNGFGAVAIIPSAQGAEVDNNAALNVQSASFFAVADGHTTNFNQGTVNTSYGDNEGMVGDAGASIGASKEQSEVIHYSIQKGDTLASIEAVLGVSENDLLQYNPSVDFSSLTPGTVIAIPSER